jgi:hypothetical protein
MTTFRIQMHKCVEAQISKLLEKISGKYNIPINELLLIWDPEKEVVEEEQVQQEVPEEEPKQEEEEEEEQVQEEEPKQEEEEEKKRKIQKAKQYKRCQYVFTRGKRKGEMCGAKACKNSLYCSKHKKYETKKKKEKAVIPGKKKVANVLKRNRALNKYWHPETGMVFKSKEEKIVIGKYVNGEMIPLVNEDIEICKKYCFKYEKPSEAEKIRQDVERAILDSNKDAEDIENFLGILQEDKSDIYSEDELLEEED